ncbi:MAG TPA: DUF222 domain-containing protein [Nocardioidaceae bacterium]|nr:DUF222 domain-containing protein [Nocardioidaceae bacterium]
MFDIDAGGDGCSGKEAGALSVGQLASMASALERLGSGVSDAERVEQIRLLEELKSAAAAAQAEVTADFVRSQEAAQREAGVRRAHVGKGVAAQVGLAKRESPARARRYVGWARILVAELPHTFAALRRGEISEWRAMIVARETGWLSVEHRAQVDADLAGRLGEWGDRRVEAETRRLAYRLDPHGFVGRSRQQESERRVSLRPAPDTMSMLSALLPVAQGVAVHASLKQQADTLRSGGDPRSRGQIMADTLVERVTGQATAQDVPVEVNLVVTDQTLLAGGDEPAVLEGYGPVPAPLARRLLRDADDTTRAWVRRLFTRPDTGDLVAMESHRRRFEGGLRQFLITRDQYCRTPWCGAPIRHLDHPLEFEDGGPTSAANGQGLCEACNYAKQASGWSARPGVGGAGQTVVTTTPTGHTYTSRPPDPPGKHPPVTARSPGLIPPTPSRLEHFLRELILAA